MLRVKGKLDLSWLNISRYYAPMSFILSNFLIEFRVVRREISEIKIECVCFPSEQALGSGLKHSGNKIQ